MDMCAWAVPPCSQGGCGALVVGHLWRLVDRPSRACGRFGRCSRHVGSIGVLSSTVLLTYALRSSQEPPGTWLHRSSGVRANGPSSLQRPLPRGPGQVGERQTLVPSCR
eukprot:5845253-Alexandrium_andersonii.AAC.1